MPSRWMKRQESDTIETTLNESDDVLESSLHKENTIEKMEWDSAHLSSEEIDLTEQKPTIQNTHRFMNGNIEGFTLLQAVQYLLDNDIITTRGEGLDFLAILQDRRIIEPCIETPLNWHIVSYERRFRTTIFHVLQLASLRLYRYPEISAYNHSYFEDRINYVYFLYVLKGLIKMPHVQIIEKVLSFIYFNEDFFNGKHRLQVLLHVEYSLVVSRNHLP